MNTKSITEGALIAVISLILCLISYYIPIFSGFTYFLIPIPIIVMYKRHGTLPAVITSLVASLLLLFFFEPINALLTASYIILPGLTIGYTYYKNSTGGIRVFYGYFGYFFALALEIIFFQIISGTSFMDELMTELNTAMIGVKDTYQAAGMFSGDQGTQLLESFDEIMETIKYMLPSIMLAIPLAFSYCTVLITDLFFKKLKIKYIPVKSITEWRLSTIAKNSLAVITLIVLLLNLILKDTNYAIYSYTMETILTSIYTIMGLSFIFWYISFKSKRKLIIVRILIIICCFIFSFLMSILMIVGVFDIYFDLRKFIKLRNNEQS